MLFRSLARRVQDLGVGLVVAPDDGPALDAALERLLGGACRSAAQALAGAHAGARKAMTARMLEAVARLLAGR